MKLYELSESMKSFYDAVYADEIPDEAFGDTLDALTEEFDDKIDGICCVVKELRLLASGIGDEIKALSERKKAIENKEKSLCEYIKVNMIKAGRDRLETARNRVSFRKSEAVKIEDELLFLAAVDNDRFIIAGAPKIDKTAIKEALKNGETVQFAELVNNENLQIK